MTTQLPSEEKFTAFETIDLGDDVVVWVDRTETALYIGDHSIWDYELTVADARRLRDFLNKVLP